MRSALEIDRVDAICGLAHFKTLCQELSGGMAGGAKTTARERKEKQTEASLVHALRNFLREWQAEQKPKVNNRWRTKPKKCDARHDPWEPMGSQQNSQ
jgi:hypothetical protein